MFALRCAGVALGIAVAILSGCKDSGIKKYDLSVKHPELYGLPPDDPRYNNPPESEYKKPPPKEFFRAGPGAIDQGMGGNPVMNQGQPPRR